MKLQGDKSVSQSPMNFMTHDFLDPSAFPDGKLIAPSNRNPNRQFNFREKKNVYQYQSPPFF